MLFTHKELIERYKSDYQIQKELREKRLYKIKSGLYSDKMNNHYLEIFQKEYPNTIISGDSAYYYHNLTDVIPSKLHITTKRTSIRLKNNNIHQAYIIDDYYDIGKTVIEYEGINITIYDRERMLIELVKNKKRMPYDYYKEIINNYRIIKDALDLYKLEEYLEVFSNGGKLMNIIQDEVF